jgi:CubicO group peptidase (beta-lactamase class C family)
MANIQGFCSDEFIGVREAFEKNLDSGADIGASAAVFIDGEPVVDIWGGYLDKEHTQPWQRDTIINNFSTTKTMAALCFLILADRGEIDLHAPVAKYWPEFAAAGKERVEVRHLLGHTSGLPGWTEWVALEDIYDPERSTALLARQAPWWEPGTASGYHPITFAGPLGADYYIGTGPELDDRVAPMIQSSPFLQPSGKSTLYERALFNPYITPQISATIPWRRAELGGSNGHGNARSVAAVQSVLACGGEVRGVRLLSEAGCERVFETQADGIDLLMSYPIRWGMGYAIDSPLFESMFGSRVDGRRVACWGGSGGSWVQNDFDARMTVAYVMNKHVEAGGFDERAMSIVRAAYDSLPVAA